MTTTLELPEDLVQIISVRAQQGGRDFQDEVANLLRKGLAAIPPVVPVVNSGRARIETDPETGFPVVRCGADAPARHMSAAELIALEKDSLEQEDLERFGLPH